MNNQISAAESLECKKIVSLKLKAFHSQMNPHFIFNSLNSIQYFITINDKELSLKYLSIFSKLIRFNLKYLDRDSILISDEILMLNWYLSLQKLRYSDSFNYQVTIEDELIDSTAEIPTHILQSLYENIIEHAVYNQHIDHSLLVDFKRKNNQILVNTSYNYLPKKDSNHNKPPIYRKQITKWQDQIRLYNKFKKQSIQKKITFQNYGILQGGKIQLILPIIN